MKAREALDAVIVTAAVLMLAGCGITKMDNPDPPPGTPNFQQGFRDGCASGNAEAGYLAWQRKARRDWTLYKSDADYKMGWDEGRNTCFTEAENYIHGRH